MQYGNHLASTYSELNIQIVSVENESKEKIEELNKKIDDISSKFNTQLNNNITTLGKNVKDA
jgi:hypothetical protein